MNLRVVTSKSICISRICFVWNLLYELPERIHAQRNRQRVEYYQYFATFYCIYTRICTPPRRGTLEWETYTNTSNTGDSSDLDQFSLNISLTESNRLRMSNLLTRSFNIFHRSCRLR